MSFSKRILTGLARRAAMCALDLLEPGKRAEVLETLVEKMVTIVSLDGVQITLYTPFPGLMYRANTLLTKEVDTIAWIDSFNANSVLWDIGANVGTYSLYAAVKRQCVVVAFEPAVSNFYALTRSIELNKLESSITAYCLAFSQKSRLGMLNLPSHSMGGSSNQFGRVGDVSPYSQTTQPHSMHGMLGFTIDEFIRQFEPIYPNHIKLDVDGLEFEILSGARSTLEDPRLESVMVELSATNEREASRAADILLYAGFQLTSQGEIQGVGLNKGVNKLFRRRPPVIESTARS